MSFRVTARLLSQCSLNNTAAQTSKCACYANQSFDCAKNVLPNAKAEACAIWKKGFGDYTVKETGPVFREAGILAIIFSVGAIIGRGSLLDFQV
eukprot:CAMPEP_0184669814 /NCGR_PEP_ID=MMETSP0308-20130426/79229_1 /TAXON_ID=38269 /ORGANISM="Gloeochaete witrockiana, Strain SAG 46.84" /LENGTH=93 /DNA_ID=CAMNT_0027116267 /DNA_START=54 /DNA_END=335 /DNA_ORIENTATION=-